MGGLGDGPPKFEVGQPMHPSPQYFEKYSVIGCEAKYKLTKKVSRRNIFLSEIEAFGQEKKKRGGHICYVSDFRL